MYEEWKPIYTALAADVMDSLGRRNQILEHQVRPATSDTCFAGPAVTLDGYESQETSDDPYGMIFSAYDDINRARCADHLRRRPGPAGRPDPG